MTKKPGWWEKMYSSKTLDYEEWDNVAEYKAGFLLFRRNSGDGGNGEEGHTNYAYLGPVQGGDVKEGQKQDRK